MVDETGLIKTDTLAASDANAATKIIGIISYLGHAAISSLSEYLFTQELSSH